jgi:NAD-dependent histone deacetylase SIR2
MRQKAYKSEPSQIHRLLKRWKDQGRLMRVYTQNIDGLEQEAGLSVVPLGRKHPETSEVVPAEALQPSMGVVVQLHGCFRKLRFRCTICHTVEDKPDYFEDTLDKLLAANKVPRCNKCSVRRGGLPSRNATIGILRPDVVLFNEDHPHGEEIQRIMTADSRGRPDLLLIIGTRIDIVGIRSAIKGFGQAMHADRLDSGEELPRPMVLFVNREAVPLGSWQGVIDVAMWIDCQRFVDSLGLEEESGSNGGEEEMGEFTQSGQEQKDKGTNDGNDANETLVSLDETEVSNGGKGMWEISRQMIKEAEECARVADAYRMFRMAGFDV